MKHLILKIKRALVWTFSRQVLDAINAGWEFAEVEALVERLASGRE